MNIRLERAGRLLPAWLMSAVLLGFMIAAACGSEPRAAEQGQGSTEEKAPSFELPEARGGTLSLSQILEGRDAAALVFYRGFF